MDRISAILAAPEAAGPNRPLAERLAFKTAMTPSEAIACLRATPAGRQIEIDQSWTDVAANVGTQHQRRTPARKSPSVEL